MANSSARQLVTLADFDRFVRSAEFRAGVDDYRAGKWQEYPENYEQSVYESGRMLAAWAGAAAACDTLDYFRACDARIFPVSVPEHLRRIVPRVIVATEPADKLFDW